MADGCIRIGDQICLFSEESKGYVFNFGSSSSYSSLYAFCDQAKSVPAGVSNPHSLVFQLEVKHKYLADKEYRSHLDKIKLNPKDENLVKKLESIKESAEIESKDNQLEQKRQCGRRLRYGQIIQLRHVFSDKFVEASAEQSSSQDRNFLLAGLSEYNSKRVQFSVQPSHKVKAEGDVVEEGDTLVLESVKCPDQYLHCSAPYKINNIHQNGCEINLGLKKSGFSMTIYCRRSLESDSNAIKGGSMIRLFHKELEAYLVAEDSQHQNQSESVYLRMRPMNSSRPKTMFPSTSAITYWQIEHDNSILNGNTIHWKSRVRLRHVTTNKYLSINGQGDICLNQNGRDPSTQFILRSVTHSHSQKSNCMTFDSFVTIQHRNKWIHSLNDENNKKSKTTNDDIGIEGLKWDRADRQRVVALYEKALDDAFVLQEVSDTGRSNFNFISGVVPIVTNMCLDSEKEVSQAPNNLLNRSQVLDSITDFMIIDGRPNKDCQKLLRNLQVVDLLVRFLRSKPNDLLDQDLSLRIYLNVYDVLVTFLKGNSSKNKLYFARHFSFFSEQYCAQDETGHRAATIITELIRNNRQLVDRISKEEIDKIVAQVKEHKKYYFLDLLGVLCVCGGVYLVDNQTYICQKWLQDDSTGTIRIELGSGIGKEADTMYVQTNPDKQWEQLNHLCADCEQDEYKFLLSQLDLFGKLCAGRNSLCISTVTSMLKYQEAYMCLTDNNLPDSLRAKYADLIKDLFVDVTNNESIMDQLSISFVYEDIGSGMDTMKSLVQEAPLQLADEFCELQGWITGFIYDNQNMVAREVGHNLLIERVLALVYQLVKFGYYTSGKDINLLVDPLVRLIDGRNDTPHRQKVYHSDEIVKRYRKLDRFEPGVETSAVVDAKYKGLEVVDLLLKLEFNTRLEKFVVLYKKNEKTKKGRMLSHPILDPHNKPNLREHSHKDITTILSKVTLFNLDDLTNVLMDVCQYKHDRIIHKSMQLLFGLYSEKTGLVDTAAQAQFLVTEESVRHHKAIQKKIPVLKRISHKQIGERHAPIITEIMNDFSRLCHLPGEPEETHSIHQKLLQNHGVLEIVFEIILQNTASKQMEALPSVREALTATVRTLRALTRRNEPVQTYVFNRMNQLLSVTGVEAAVASVLIEVFTANQRNCLKVQAAQIERIAGLAARHGESVPEYLDLLTAIITVDQLDLPLRRNQEYVMKTIMLNSNQLTGFLNISAEERKKILRREKGSHNLGYTVSLVDLIATCAQGQNRLAQSTGQNSISVAELVAILTDQEITHHVKTPFLKFLLNVYLSSSDTAADTCTKLWDILKDILNVVADVVEYIGKATVEDVNKLLRTTPTIGDSAMVGKLHFLFEAAFPFLEVFFTSECDFEQSEMKDVVNSLAKKLRILHESIKPIIPRQKQLRNLAHGILSVLTQASVHVQDFELYASECSADYSQDFRSAMRKEYDKYYDEELELNERLAQFSRNYGMLYRGPNTCQEQIECRGDKPYNDPMEERPLPLGGEFQDLVDCFIHPKRKARKYEKTNRLIAQLQVSAFRLGDKERSDPNQISVDVTCIQVLRALIHNQERKLTYDWDNQLDLNSEKLRDIEAIQNELNSYGVILKTMPLVERKQGDISKEYVSLWSVMLFNVSKSSQKAFGEYVLQSKDEKILHVVRDKLQFSLLARKERRMIAMQIASNRKDEKEKIKSLRSKLRRKRASMQSESPVARRRGLMFSEDVTEVEVSGDEDDEGDGEEGAVRAEEVDREISAITRGMLADSDDDIELVLRCLIGGCSGQNKVMQNYLREQPQNMKQINLVADITQYLEHIYSKLSTSNFNLSIRLFTTLIELASGNAENRAVIFENNIVDYINHILRSTRYKDIAPPRQVLKLLEGISSLFLTMIEERTEESKQVNQELCSTIHHVSIKSVAVDCYRSSSKYPPTDPMKDHYMRVAFVYHLILERIADEAQSVNLEDLYSSRDERPILTYFRNNFRTIEIVKDGGLQRIRFRVKTQNLLREEIRNEIKWGGERVCVRDKVRRLVEWADDINDDAVHMKNLQKHTHLNFISLNWHAWNYVCMIISLIVSIFMLLTWNAKTALGKGAWPNSTQLPDSIHDFEPEVGSWFRGMTIALGVIHVICALLMIVSYILTKRPYSPPFVTSMRTTFNVSGKENEKGEPVSTRKSRLRTNLFSWLSLYYLVFLAMSICGAAVWGYFFAFHLLNIIYDNRGLKRLAKAITCHGRTLLWLVVLCLVFVFIFTLIGFARFRSALDPTGSAPLWCQSLGQCFLVMMRMAVIGDLFQAMLPHDSESGDFPRFAALALFHVAFWFCVTVLGVFMIFAVIIDTLSELRNKQIIAREDMKHFCYICGRQNHEFERHGNGFENHVKNEHNMWAYLLFLIHIKTTKKSDCRPLESYVLNQLQVGRYDFFPIGRAISLQEFDQDDTKRTIDELSRKVEELSQKVNQAPESQGESSTNLRRPSQLLAPERQGRRLSAQGPEGMSPQGRRMSVQPPPGYSPQGRRMSLQPPPQGGSPGGPERQRRMSVQRPEGSGPPPPGGLQPRPMGGQRPDGGPARPGGPLPPPGRPGGPGEQPGGARGPPRPDGGRTADRGPRSPGEMGGTDGQGGRPTGPPPGREGNEGREGGSSQQPPSAT